MTTIHGNVIFYYMRVEDGKLKVRSKDKSKNSTRNAEITQFIANTDKRLKKLPDLQLFYQDFITFGFTDDEASWLTGIYASAGFSGQHSDAMDYLFCTVCLHLLTDYANHQCTVSPEITMVRTDTQKVSPMFYGYQDVVFTNTKTGYSLTHEYLSTIYTDAIQLKATVANLLSPTYPSNHLESTSTSTSTPHQNTTLLLS